MPLWAKIFLLGFYHNDKSITGGSDEPDLLNRLNSCVVEFEMKSI